MELDLRPQFYSNSRSVVLVPVVLPQLRTKMNKVYHARTASFSLSSSKTKLWLQHILDILKVISNGILSFQPVPQRLTFDVERVTFSGIFG